MARRSNNSRHNIASPLDRFRLSLRQAITRERENSAPTTRPESTPMEQQLKRIMTQLRGKNPFFRKFDKDDTSQSSGLRWKPTPWSAAEYKQASQVSEYIKTVNEKSFRVHGPRLYQAGEAILKLRHSTTRHIDEEMKRVLDYYVALVGKTRPGEPAVTYKRPSMRCELETKQRSGAVLKSVGKPDPNSVDSIINSHCDTSNVQQYKKWVGDLYRSVKFHTTGYFKQNVYELARLLGGVTRFRQIARIVRKAVYARLLAAGPVAVLRYAFKGEYRAVDIEGIFASDTTPKHRLWQAIYKRKFVKLCLTTDDRFLPLPEEDKAKSDSDAEIGGAYDDIMTDKKIKDLGIPMAADGPSRADRKTTYKSPLFFSGD
ncbi:hypothetical protein M409DRAFT_21883 [Zasmidium cellare ATCC 36951]|uniref:Uncharacterized protein n=1 Tax=Zasmidium cellare ATCC 36951 TaxID=1080233 RepID=A0A6A6CL10_ZASCE|nr:uncharacterized protein M409DRAFT_21883 [Zasmidium cellare ATCC 36951]KAF2167731.1 hypothetical protein M409DRAFT_21883 [Zasmidium cellare ATCC 36951]